MLRGNCPLPTSSPFTNEDDDDDDDAGDDGDDGEVVLVDDHDETPTFPPLHHLQPQRQSHQPP